MDDEQKRHIAELEGKVRELEAAVRMWQERWASVPWDALYDIVGDIGWEEGGSSDKVELWRAANAPKEPTP